MASLATNADVTTGDGPAYGLMAYPDEGCAFVDLVRKAGSLRGGTDEVYCVCFHMHNIAPTGTSGNEGLSTFNASLFFPGLCLYFLRPSPAELDS